MGVLHTRSGIVLALALMVAGCTTIVGVALIAIASPAGAQLFPGGVWTNWETGNKRPLMELLGEGYEVKAAIHTSDAHWLYVQRKDQVYNCLTFTSGVIGRFTENPLGCSRLVPPHHKK